MTTAQLDILNIILAHIIAFCQDPRTAIIGVLIVLDLGTGIMAALRTGTFDLGELARFYRTNVLPFLIGYGLGYILSGVVNDLMQNSDPQLRPILVILADIMQQIAQYGGFIAIVGALGASIVRNIGEVRTAIPVSPLRTALRETRRPIARILGG